MQRRDNLDCFFNPRSIAVVGASPEGSKLSNVILKSLKNAGFSGDIYPINPKYGSIEGLKCYSSLDALEKRADLAIFAMSAPRVVELIKGFGHKLHGVIIISGGFGESGPEGMALEGTLRALIREHPIRVIGPNCLGIYDTASKIDTFFIPAERFKRPANGGLSIISQSGSFALTAMDELACEGIGVSKVISYGNMIDVSESDCLDYLAGDESTRAVAMYMESVSDGKSFVKAAAACSGKKPVIAIKAGRSRVATSAALSHTGAIAGRYELYRAAFRKAGIVEVTGYEDFISGCKALGLCRPAAGGRVMIITDGGGMGVSIADAAVAEGLDVAPLPARVAAELKEALPPFCTVGNPLDLTGSVTDELYGEALEKTLSSGYYDMAIIATLLGPPALTDDLAKTLAAMHGPAGKPMIICSPGGEYTKKKNRLFMDLGLPVFTSPESAVRGASVLARTGKVLRQKNLRADRKKR
jgi:acyl-CoA synthetase (NDP forming)